MRRAMMTNRPTAGPPFTVGNPAVSASAAGATARVIVDRSSVAPRAGTITSVDFYAGVAGDVYLLTGTVSGSTLTITAVTAVTATLGANTFPVSLSISSGGVIGYAYAGGQGAYNSSVGSLSYSTSTVTPTVGGTYALTSITGRLSEQGTGS